MKKIVILQLVIYSFMAEAQVQTDKIYRQDNSAIDAKVIKITETTIEFINPANPEGPNYSIPVNQVRSIQYSNGFIETFQPMHEDVPSRSQPIQQPVRNGEFYSTPSVQYHQNNSPPARFSQQQYQVNNPSSTMNYQAEQRYDGIGRREPIVAFALSFLLPGAGQLYNKEYGKAGIMSGGYVASWILLYSSVQNSVYDFYSGYYEEGGWTTGVYLGIAGIIGTGLWSMIDAPLSAKRINQRLGLSNVKIQPHTTFALTGEGKTPAFGAKLIIEWN